MKKMLIFILFASAAAQLSAQERDCSEIAILEKRVDGLTACELESAIERRVQELSGVEIASLDGYYVYRKIINDGLHFSANYKSEKVNFECQVIVHNKSGFIFLRPVSDRSYFLSMYCENARFEIREDLLQDFKFYSGNQYVHEVGVRKTIIQ